MQSLLNPRGSILRRSTIAVGLTLLRSLVHLVSISELLVRILSGSKRLCTIQPAPPRPVPASVNASLERGEIKSLPTPFKEFLRGNSYSSVRLRNIRALLTFSMFRSYFLANYGTALHGIMAEPRAIGLQYVHQYPIPSRHTVASNNLPIH
jgi:hypothetical protein